MTNSPAKKALCCRHMATGATKPPPPQVSQGTPYGFGSGTHATLSPDTCCMCSVVTQPSRRLSRQLRPGVRPRVNPSARAASMGAHVLGVPSVVSLFFAPRRSPAVFPSSFAARLPLRQQDGLRKTHLYIVSIFLRHLLLRAHDCGSEVVLCGRGPRAGPHNLFFETSRLEAER